MSDSTVGQFPWEGAADLQIPWDAIPDHVVIDQGLATLEIVESDVRMTKANPSEGKVSKLMFVIKSKVVEPSSCAGLTYTDFFVIGMSPTEKMPDAPDDPEAKDPKTWAKSSGAQNFKKLIRAAAVTTQNSAEATLFSAKGCRWSTEMQIEKDANDVPRNRAKGYFPVGQKGARPAGVARPLMAPGVGSSRAPVVQTEAKVNCPTCNDPVPRSQYGSHVASHQAGPDVGDGDNQV